MPNANWNKCFLGKVNVNKQYLISQNSCLLNTKASYYLVDLKKRQLYLATISTMEWKLFSTLWSRFSHMTCSNKWNISDSGCNVFECVGNLNFKE
jgi:hypothetical protein